MDVGVAPALVAGFFAALAAVVLAARPEAALNRIAAGYLLLRGGATIAYAASRAATDAGAAVAYQKMAVWYTVPLPVLAVALACTLFVAPGARRRAVLAAAAVASAVVAAAFALDGALLVGAAVPRAGGVFAVESGLLLYGLNAAFFLTEAALVALAARTVASAAATPVERRRAATLGVAFSLPVVYAGAAFAPLVVDRAVGASAWSPAFAIPATAALASLAVALRALPRLALAFERRGRAAAIAGVAAAAAIGIVDGVAAPLALRGVDAIPRYDNAVLVLRAAFAALAAVALVRFGLAGFTATGARRLARAMLAGLAVAAALLAGGLALALAGVTTAGLVAAPVVAAAALLLSPLPLRAAARDLAARVVARTSDADAAGERARLYAAALARGAGDAELARLRRDLGVTDAEHASLAASGAAVPRVLGRYEVVRELGRGAFGTAELARDAATGREVVLKRFHGGRAAEAAAREGRALAAVRHPRIVPFLDVDRVGDEVFLVMGYAPGGSLRGRLDRDGPMPPERAVAHVADALDGLATLHAAGLVHRDVKLENLLLDADGRVLLGDFGSARFLAADPSVTITGAGVAGSLATIAPEVLRGAPATPAADVYAAGAVLYRLVTGEHYVALDGADAFAARERVLRDAPRLPHPRVPAGVEAIVRRALAKRPEDRYADAAAMRDALAATSALTPAGTRGASAPR